MKRLPKKLSRQRTLCASLCLTVSLSSALMLNLLAHASPAPRQFPSSGQGPAAAPGPVKPNFTLAARFVPSQMSKLVFDTSVTPHWCELSDCFWFSFKTTDGTRYWLVDPARRTKVPLFNNAKLAAQLSTLTDYPYDAQHLPIKNLMLVKKDAALQFDVEVANDAVIPNAPKQQENNEETIQEGVNQNRQNEDQQTEGAQQPKKSAKPKTRKIYFEYELATGKLTRLDNFQPPPVKPIWASISPNGQTVVFARGYNLYMMDASNYAKAARNPGDKSVVEAQLTTDGVAKYSYARHLITEELDALKKFQKGDNNPAGPRRPAVPIFWSKDSKKFALIRADNRKVGDLWVIHTLARPRPILETYSYAMAGEVDVPQFQMLVFDVATKQHVVIQTAGFKDESLSIATDRLLARDREHRLQQLQGEKRNFGGYGGFMHGPWLSDTSDKLYYIRSSRDLHRIDVCVADTTTGASKVLIRERSNLDMDTKPLRLINNGRELIWWSERDGWGHYYLYDSDGKLENQITSGPYMSDNILSIDAKNRLMYFIATGHEPGQDPYYKHLYRANLDGTGLKLLTPGNYNDSVSASDSGKYFINTFSRADTAPKSVLYDDDGTSLVNLATTDVSRLFAAGYKYPQTFHVKAADGITDLYGVMYKPFDFDSARKYPLVEYVYPGPQTEAVSRSFNPKDQNIALAQLGFIVIEVGNRGGSPNRDKWYDSYGYGNLRDYGLADKKVAAQELAALHPYVDINRVGIWGHSGGGFMTAAAMLQYPDFFKVGWSESGNHQNNVYNKYWSEKYNGIKEIDEKNGEVKFIYHIEKNSELAKNLKGHLMLTTGDMDNNVHMANTMRLAEALIKANKRFDMFVFPGLRHSYLPDAEYVFWMRANYFCRWLLGSSETGPDVLEMDREHQATPSDKFNP